MKKLIPTILVAVGIMTVAIGFLLRAGTKIKAAEKCRNQLRGIEFAKERCALQTAAKPGDPVTVEKLLPFSYMQPMPTCDVAGAKYIIGNVGEEPRCTFHGTVSHFSPDRY